MKHCLSIILLLAAALPCRSQVVGIRSNVLSDITTTMNLGLEIGLGPRVSLDLPVSYNPWEFGDRKMFKHVAVQPEVRWWLCNRFSGHFFGFHAHYASFNVRNVKLPFGIYPGVEHGRYEGDLFGFGLSYGYQWIIGRHWGLEATVGLGYARIIYDRYKPCCGEKTWSGTKNYWGPTRLGLNFVYYIK